MLSQKITDFLFALKAPNGMPAGVEVMNPFALEETRNLCHSFYRKYYGDDQPRRMVLGINPGRFGGGTTGISFTDPVRLENVCKISNALPKKQELSSVFVYDMIEAYGGPTAFYRNFYITSVFPLGFTRNGKNLNYYDEKPLEEMIRPLAVAYIREQIEFGLDDSVAYCFGEGKNYAFLQKINTENKLFGSIVPLPHPRFIMQYRLKRKQEFINLYVERFKKQA